MKVEVVPWQVEVDPCIVPRMIEKEGKKEKKENMEMVICGMK